MTDRAVVFRDGPDMYDVWREFKVLPVISVAPVRRPKLDETGTRYSFGQERELMKEKMRTILRIAKKWGNSDVVLGPFGVGPIFRNPRREVAIMWRELLFFEPEFRGAFSNVVFAIQRTGSGDFKSSVSDYEAFKEILSPSNIFRNSRPQ